MQRIGLLGGSFNPVHLGHLLVAQAAREELQLSRLFFIPAAQSPFKPGLPLAPAEQRLRLLRLALAGQTDCEIDDLEIKRGGVSYTIDTLRDYVRRFPGARSSAAGTGGLAAACAVSGPGPGWISSWCFLITNP